MTRASQLSHGTPGKEPSSFRRNRASFSIRGNSRSEEVAQDQTGRPFLALGVAKCLSALTAHARLRFFFALRTSKYRELSSKTQGPSGEPCLLGAPAVVFDPVPLWVSDIVVGTVGRSGRETGFQHR